MNWLCCLIVFQYTILLLHGRPDTSSTSSAPEKTTLKMEHPSSVSAIITSLGNEPSLSTGSADLKKHLATTIAVSPPAQVTKRVLSTTAQIKKVEPTKKVTNSPQSHSFSPAAAAALDAIAKTTRNSDDLNSKLKSLVTTTTTAKNDASASTATTTAKTTTTAAPSTTTTTKKATTNANKPSIYEIITETEKNHTQATSRAQSALPSTSAPPLALALSSQLPAQNQRSGDSPKAIGHHVEMHYNHGHPGVAEPLTWQQLESEMSMVDQSLKESSTSKDGISTWILLSGSDKQPQMLQPTPATTTVSHVEKFDVQDKLSDRPNYRFGEVHSDKIVKPSKIRDSTENKKPKPDKKNKIGVSTASVAATKTTPLPSIATSGLLLASDFMNDKNRRKTPLANTNKLNKRKTTTTTTSTSVSTEHAIASSEKLHEAFVTVEEAEITTPVSFIELEPKDANFDLPQDRSPATKKPQKPKQTKRKPSKKNKVTSVTKQPVKNKDKPISTTIYNYLSREVMPLGTVGILGAGILLTAGLASYILGPFGALRRSYDDATDRKDNIENIYSVNSEEYASEGSDNGQHEEEVFSKFLAGMPYRDVPRYVKYFKQQDGTRVNQAMPANYPYRPQVRLQAQSQPQASNVAPKYSPYMRYRMAPSPHYNTAQYNPQQPYQTYRNHQMSTQPAAQPQSVSPVYNPQYHEMQKQKSFSNNMDSILKHQTTIYGKSSDATGNQNANAIEEKSIGSIIQAESETETSDQTENDVTETQPLIDDMSAQMQRRTNTYVVGSTITDSQPGVAVVSASMTASVDGLPSTKHKGIVESVEPGVITVTASSHGPRRRRRNTESVTKNAPKETTIKTTVYDKPEISTTKATTMTMTETKVTAAPTTTTTQNTRLYSKNELSSLTYEFNLLNEKIMSYDREYVNDETRKKVERKIHAEFKSITTDYQALKHAIDGANAIEQFEKQAHINAKNYELSMVLKTGITTLHQRIKHLNDLVENPDDERIIEKINRRNGAADGINSSVGTTIATSATSSSGATTSTTGQFESENGFVGFLKILQLKAQFGLNLLQNIRPSFERAFEEVFKRPYEKPN